MSKAALFGSLFGRGPAECAPLSNGDVIAIEIAMLAALGACLAFIGWGMVRTWRRQPAGWQFTGALSGVVGAVFLLSWLAGGTSC